MKNLRKYLIISLIAAVLFALPVTVMAGKRIYKANLRESSVVNSAFITSARGVGILGVTPGGVVYQMSASNLDTEQNDTSLSGGGDVAVHIHGPATESENGPIVVTLCGSPAPSVSGECKVVDGFLKLDGKITNEIVGMTNKEFKEALEGGLLYIQVHIDGSPVIRGQLYEN